MQVWVWYPRPVWEWVQEPKLSLRHRYKSAADPPQRFSSLNTGMQGIWTYHHFMELLNIYCSLFQLSLWKLLPCFRLWVKTWLYKPSSIWMSSKLLAWGLFYSLFLFSSIIFCISFLVCAPTLRHSRRWTSLPLFLSWLLKSLPNIQWLRRERS